MKTWREEILKEFTPRVVRLTLVADPDGLMVEEGILQGIRERGFELIPFEDHVAFRYAYESTFRSRWDRGEQTDLVVVLRSASSGLNSLPYDLLQAGRKLSFSLGDLFPNLSYPVVTELDRGDLDVLYQAQLLHAPGKLGDNATKDFTLRHVFEIAPELIRQPPDLLRILLRRHYRGQRVPGILDERFMQILGQSDRFADWPLAKIVPDRQAFFAFLQERWPPFLDRIAVSPETMAEPVTQYGLTFEGPVDLPFDHEDIRIYLDNLFSEGLLSPVVHGRANRLESTWASIGIRTNPAADRERRLLGLIQSVAETLPPSDARHQEWLSFAYRWAELMAIKQDGGAVTSKPALSDLRELQGRVDSAFITWVQKRYAGLHNLPAFPPAMLHHVPRSMARHREESPTAKVALLVVDGLALDQWVVVREVLKAQRPALIFRESAVFAWIPTLTSVSRQAAFAGKAPLYFPGSIQTTEKEAALWAQFWIDQGLTPREVEYLKGLGDGMLGEVAEYVADRSLQVLGLVVDKVDRIMHGMELGTAGMHNQVRQWASRGYLAQLLDLLLDHEFHLTITSDHGNVEAEGIGRPAEGAVADLRGERVRVYVDSGLRARVKERFPEAMEWPAIGLPDDFLPLIAPGRKAFIREDERIVAHGGISLEELVVPLVHVERGRP